MLHLFLQFQATSSNSSFGEPGPHAIHTGRTCFLPGKLTSWKWCASTKKNHSSLPEFHFQVETNFVFSEIIFYWNHPTAPTSSSNEKNKNRPRWVLWSPASRLQLHKSQENDPAWSSIKQIGRNENGLRVEVRSWFLQKKDGGKGKEHLKQTNESNKSET